MLRFLTAGESHGPALTVILEGVPAGLALSASDIDRDLARRQLGYGRGRRMAIEHDRVEILSGVRHGETIGSPLTLVIRNRDWVNWQYTMSIEADPRADLPGARRGPVTRPRPGHADLAGALKFQRDDMRDILERASARETAARVAAGAVARTLLTALGMTVVSHVTEIGGAAVADPMAYDFATVAALTDEDGVRCADAAIGAAMRAAVDAAREAGDTVGGTFEIIAHSVPVGLGSHTQWDRKLDGLLAQALMSIQAIKAVGIGRGPDVSHLPGSRVHDEILRAGDAPTGTLSALRRPTNRAGGLEGGITNSEDVRVSAWMKPISTLMSPLRSVNISTMEEEPATIERSDVCAVPAAAVVGEAMVCLVLANAVLEKFGGDSLGELSRASRAWQLTVQLRLGKDAD
ncbi:MAG: chorismate synthase [Acidobacteria bacterium]|nr:chorismate synthase [Acidobacteriota bacterium]